MSVKLTISPFFSFFTSLIFHFPLFLLGLGGNWLVCNYSFFPFLSAFLDYVLQLIHTMLFILVERDKLRTVQD